MTDAARHSAGQTTVCLQPSIGLAVAAGRFLYADNGVDQ